MTIVLDRPPVILTPTEPPFNLPPIVTPPRRDRDEPIIMPDICRIEAQTKTQRDNCWTIHYQYMTWGTMSNPWQKMAHVNTREYRRWLETYPMPDGIPPHIAFGGAVESLTTGPDPTFYDRWKVYARKTFC